MDALRRGEAEPARKYGEVPTDDKGWFRLAPIGRVMPERRALTPDEITERREAAGLQRGIRFALWQALSLSEKYKMSGHCHQEFLHDTGEIEDWVFDIRPIPVTADELAGDGHKLSRHYCPCGGNPCAVPQDLHVDYRDRPGNDACGKFDVLEIDLPSKPPPRLIPL